MRMSPSRQILAGISGGIAFAFVDEVVINDQIASLVSLSFAAVVTLIGVIRGQKSSHFFRAFISVLIFYWGYSVCLLGRTMEPGISVTTVKWSIMLFFIYGLLPGFALLRLWPLRWGIALLVGLLPASFLFAALVAGTEEYLFVKKYRDTGVGPTARWTVPHHWLAYNHEAQRLDGSD